MVLQLAGTDATGTCSHNTSITLEVFTDQKQAPKLYF